MRQRNFAIAASSLIILSACQSPTNAAETQAASEGRPASPQTQQPLSARSPCAREQVAVIACRLQSTGRVAAVCATPSPNGTWRFRFQYSEPGKNPIAASPTEGMDDGRRFTRSRLMLFGGAGGLVYSTVADGQRYSLYSIQGKGFERAGLQISSPGAELAASDDECVNESIITSENDALLKATDQWASDPTFEDKGLPQVSKQR